MDRYEKIASNIVSKPIKADELSRIVDTFVRFLVGDRRAAISQLGSFMRVDIGVMPSISNPEEYNKVFDNLFQDIQKAIRNNIPRR
jgi:hypothetical protein